MTSTQKIRLGNVFATLITAVVCYVLADDPWTLYMTLIKVLSSEFMSASLTALVACFWMACVVAAVFYVAHKFVFRNPLIRFFYRIPVPCKG